MATGNGDASSVGLEFVDFACQQQVLRFGEFTLKSGRASPYFFNAGLFASGEALARLGDFYADAIVASGIEFDCIFGPAYKGIPLAAAVTISLYQRHKRSVPYVYNRKEAKDHGEGGVLVGTLAGRALVVDDVITAGTAIRESVDMIVAHPGCSVAGVVVAMDREEKFQEGLNVSAIQQVENDFGFRVVSIAQMRTLIAYIEERYHEADRDELLERIRKYRADFGIN